ncbi:uncharacterized protein FIBRA_01823 [Fibroporia radiculosa]|uniref:Uncharacterized protein n=1 Tax=Fibroporia radiculosa TaxID=599839 RepID=J4H1G0_9APHY|nr:uncharacterized protein FIBRA_01823 [Fibroporia radiculosa]CCL99799.1 predicted protein [Fibroporia radiculosa]
MPTLGTTGWKVKLHTKRGVVEERDVVENFGGTRCRISCSPGVQFYFSFETRQNRGGVYVEIFMDGIQFEHFCIPGGITSMNSYGWQDPKTRKVHPFAWKSARTLCLADVVERTTTIRLHGTIIIRLYRLQGSLCKAGTYLPDPSPLRSKCRPKQTYYAHIGKVALPVSKVPRDIRRSCATGEGLGPILAHIRFEYLQSVLQDSTDLIVAKNPFDIPVPAGESLECMHKNRKIVRAFKWSDS